MPLEENTASEEISKWNEIALKSNSNLVYACDELGNQIAVALIVNPSFNVDGKVKVDNAYDSQNIQQEWVVAAVEECSTACDDNKIDLNVEDQPRNSAIRKYKVGKGSRVQKENFLTKKGKAKTLKIKKNEVLAGRAKRQERVKVSKNVVTKMEQEVHGNVKSMPRRRQRKMQYDKAYRFNGSLKYVKLQSKSYLYFIN